MLPSWQKAVSRLKSRPAFPNRRRLHKPSNPRLRFESAARYQNLKRRRAFVPWRNDRASIERPSDVISLLIKGDADDAAVTTELAAALARYLHCYKRNAIPDS